MIFNSEFDMGLYIILLCDIRNRESIGRIIYNMPEELLRKIRILFSEENIDDEFWKKYKYANKDEDNNMYMYVVNVCFNEISIVYNKWGNGLEEKYELRLGRVNKDCNEYPLYLGNYSENRSMLIYKLVIVKGMDRDYELVRKNFVGDIISLSDDPKKYWVVNLEKRDMEIFKEDLKDMVSINKLVRRRNKNRI